MRFVRRLGESAYDLALADPPYDTDDAAELISVFRKTPFAQILGVEHGARTSIDGDDTRVYGDVALTFCYAP